MSVKQRDGGNGRNLRLSDIAAALGISKATVSLAINNNPKVSEKTRQRVLEKIKELGYVYNRGAAGLSTGTSNTIGLAVHNLSNPYFTEVCSAVESVFSDKGRMPFLCNTRESLDLAIEKVVAKGKRISDIGVVIQDHVEASGFSVVRDFVGHGIGRSLHEEPQIPHYRSSGHNERIRPGMVLAIEPMVNVGTWEVEAASDGWTQVTKDRQLSAHFEHSVAVSEEGPVVLSRLEEGEQ